ncbi:thiolase-like protein [Xylaria nigripes]|nr:thiolase-like protein [Xylaria nigripes]
MTTSNTVPAVFGQLCLSIIGLGSQYPPNKLKADELDKVAAKFHPESPAMSKVLSINRFTGIETRSSIGTSEHPLVNKALPPSIRDLHTIFMHDGLPLAVAAARKALAEARLAASQITHLVSTTCTDSANPGFDHYVAQELGLSDDVEKVLLHGVGCSGGLATLRTGANLALGHRFRGRPARILCLALEISTTMVRSELESIDKKQETRIGACLFSDCASAVVLSNGIGNVTAEPIYELLGWDQKVLPETAGDLGFDVDPVGWKIVLSPRVPMLTERVLSPAFANLMASVETHLPDTYRVAADFDWAMHPGGLTILTNAERTLKISSEHMRASYHRYMQHGNSSSATIFSVLDHLRSKEMDGYAPGGRVKEYVVGCAFGPGITIEMCMLKRNMWAREAQTPPETDSEGSRSERDEEENSMYSEIDGSGANRRVHLVPAGDALEEPETPIHAARFVDEALADVELD